MYFCNWITGIRPYLLLLFTLLKICAIAKTENCAISPCKNDGLCSEVNEFSVHCSCQPGDGGRTCTTRDITLWSPEGSEECSAACENLGSTAVTTENQTLSDIPIYICASNTDGKGYRAGFKQHGQPDCKTTKRESTYRCLCNNENNMEWKTAKYSTWTCNFVCNTPVYSSSHIFDGTKSARKSFLICRSQLVNGRMAAGVQLNWVSSSKCIIGGKAMATKDCLCHAGDCTSGICKNDAICSEIDKVSVHCSCQPGDNGRTCTTRDITLWTPDVSEECSTACEELNSMAVTTETEPPGSASSNASIYICASNTGGKGYRAGFKQHGQSGCITTETNSAYRCLCKNQKIFEWKTAWGGLRCSKACDSTVYSSSHVFDGTTSSRKSFRICRGQLDGRMATGVHMDWVSGNKCLIGGTATPEKDCLCSKVTKAHVFTVRLFTKVKGSQATSKIYEILSTPTRTVCALKCFKSRKNCVGVNFNTDTSTCELLYLGFTAVSSNFVDRYEMHV